MDEALGSISTEKRKKSFLKITALWPIFDLILVKMESVYQLFKKKNEVEEVSTGNVLVTHM